ncbi:MAG: polysaccharide biosynthesis protein [Gammaproteobacteria bacterium]|nr:polysaccharide biosynthesis protein [Gammaproteobacteria bacterium]MBI5616624.1 polysaccharide biosynthesis protein [Gammaproteobacteria bacterium]
MNPLRKLAGETAIYGLSTIVGRLLNYVLVPFFTYVFGQPADLGLNTEFYAYISFLGVIFTYGMEAALFRFGTTEDDPARVYATAQRAVLVSTLALAVPVMVWAGPIAGALRHGGHPEYVVWSMLIVALDALTALPFARLRAAHRAWRFASLKLANIAVNLAINFFLIGWCKWHYEHAPESLWAQFYDPRIGIAYAFIANAVASGVTLLLLAPEFRGLGAGFDATLLKRMLRYALPLLVVGLAGMVNETLDRILLKYLLPEETALTAVGIYGACYKISIIMSLFIQAFRYAAEPFFYAHAASERAPETYAFVMKAFVVCCAGIYLGTLVNMAWIQYLVGPNYRAGLGVVPILLLANLCLGVYYNLSIWYKLTDRTGAGALITLFGAAVTLALNWLLIPRLGYLGSAWATLACYALMAAVSYRAGQRHYPVPYESGRLLVYVGAAILLASGAARIVLDAPVLELLARNLMLLPFIALVLWWERPAVARLLRARAA